MKVGILTFHCAHNYGAVLQAYALQEYLKSLGHEVEFIDYRPPFLVRAYKWFNIHRLKSRNPFKLVVKIYKEIKYLAARRKRYVSFNNFILSKLNLSERILDSIPNKYNLIIVGSDQVWNINIGKGFCSFYWGNFQKTTDCKLISYAASMEENCFDNNAIRLKIQSYLNSFDAISVREEELASSLLPLYSGKIHVSLDPTLIVDRKVWMELAEGKVPSDKYILLYQVRNTEKALSIANAIAARLGARVITLSARVDIDNNPEYIASSPSRFVNLFKFASFVITTSFHGTSFAIIFNIPFYSILLNDGKDSRTLNLLKVLNLENRSLSSVLPQDDVLIDWEQVNRLIEVSRKSSVNYLNKYLS